MVRRWSKLAHVLIGLMLLGLLAACGGGNGAPSPTATPATGDQPPQQPPAASNYYEGKTVRIIIPYAPGGSSAVLVPFFATELPKFIPGAPRMTSSHLTPVTAGMNYLHAAGQDGTEMMYVASPQLAQQFAEGADFRVGNFQYVGGFTVNESVLYVTEDVTASDFLSLQPNQLRVALPTDPGDLSAAEMGVLLLADALDIPLRGIPLSGATTGTPELLVALERGDINGHISTVYYTLPRLRPGWTSDGFVRPLGFVGRPGLEMYPNAEHNVTAANITDLMMEANVDQQFKDLYSAFTIPPVSLGRHYMFPPGTDEEALNALRAGFTAAMQDAEFLAELERLIGLEPVLVEGAEFQELMEAADQAFETHRADLGPTQVRLWEKFSQR